MTHRPGRGGDIDASDNSAGSPGLGTEPMKTSNFAKSGRDPNAVAICVSPPRWWRGRCYRALAPRRDMLKLPWPVYVQEYQRILAGLDAAQVMADLGADAVLLCFEADTGECHRRLVAEWIQAETGIEVPEVEKKGKAPPPDPQGTLM